MYPATEYAIDYRHFSAPLCVFGHDELENVTYTERCPKYGEAVAYYFYSEVEPPDQISVGEAVAEIALEVSADCASNYDGELKDCPMFNAPHWGAELVWRTSAGKLKWVKFELPNYYFNPAGGRAVWGSFSLTGPFADYLVDVNDGDDEFSFTNVAFHTLDSSGVLDVWTYVPTCENCVPPTVTIRPDNF